MQAFANGSKIQVTNFSGGNDTVTLVKPLSAGTQGEIYYAKYNGSSDYLFKWIKSDFISTLSNSKNFYNWQVEKMKKPSLPQNFSWPIAITERRPNGEFGYVMKKAEDRYVSLTKFLNGGAKRTPTFNFANDFVKYRAALNLVKSMGSLFDCGYSYQDLSHNNVYFDRNNGDVFMIDVDNVVPSGYSCGVLGTPGYVAPELFSGQLNVPDRYTDMHSIAVVLFRMLVKSDPLSGDRPEDGLDDMKLYGKEALFVFDKNDKSNPPTGRQKLGWSFMPEVIREAFQKTFDKPVLRNQGGKRTERVTVAQWVVAIRKAIDEMLVCPVCGNYVFESLLDKGMFSSRKKCYLCKSDIDLPLKLVIKRGGTLEHINLFPGKDILGAHVGRPSYGIIGTVIEGDNGALILQNKSQMYWTARNNGKDYPVNPCGNERSRVKLSNGLTIIINNIDVKVEY